ncbi:MAG: DUF2769 domain-containing protein [Bacillota bacterium]
MKKVKRTRENLAKCLCKECPSYTFTCKLMAMPGNVILLIDPMDDENLHAETMFCAYNKSQCINEEKGCKCPDCEVNKENDLGKTYFCISEGGK